MNFIVQSLDWTGLVEAEADGCSEDSVVVSFGFSDSLAGRQMVTGLILVEKAPRNLFLEDRVGMN